MSFVWRNAEKAAYAVWRVCRSDAFALRTVVPGVFFFTLSTRKGRKKMNINVFFAKKKCKKQFFTVAAPANRCLQVHGDIFISGCRCGRDGLGINPTLTFLTFPGRVRSAATGLPLPGTGIESATCADRKNYMPPAKSFPAGKNAPERRHGHEKRAVSFRPRTAVLQIYDIFQPKANCVKTDAPRPAFLLDKMAISDRR